MNIVFKYSNIFSALNIEMCVIIRCIRVSLFNDEPSLVKMNPLEGKNAVV